MMIIMMMMTMMMMMMTTMMMMMTHLLTSADQFLRRASALFSVTSLGFRLQRSDSVNTFL